MEYAFSLITPSVKIFEGKIDALTAPGQEGSFGVLANHAPMVALLKKGIVMLRRGTAEEYFAISAGILEVSPQKNVLMLADAAVGPQSLPEAQKQLTKFP